jgi:hypothetical protein
MTPSLEIAPAPRRSEADTILSWRLWVLDRAGYDEDAAVALATSRHVDLHLAVDLLERGCPPDTALQILL